MSACTTRAVLRVGWGLAEGCGCVAGRGRGRAAAPTRRVRPQAFSLSAGLALVAQSLNGIAANLAGCAGTFAMYGATPSQPPQEGPEVRHGASVTWLAVAGV